MKRNLRVPDFSSLREASGLLTRGVCHYHILFTKKSQPNFSKFMFFPSCPFDQPAACPSCRPALPCRGSPSAIHEVLISLRSQGQRNVRGFDLLLGIYEVLISPISRRGAFTRPMSLRQPIYEVLISFIVLFSA